VTRRPGWPPPRLAPHPVTTVPAVREYRSGDQPAPDCQWRLASACAETVRRRAGLPGEPAWRRTASAVGDGGYFVAVFGTSGVSFGAGRRVILEPSQTSGSYLRPTTRSFIGISALSVILMCSGHTSVQHLVMLQ
jgi:hypothetical protein